MKPAKVSEKACPPITTFQRIMRTPNKTRMLATAARRVVNFGANSIRKGSKLPMPYCMMNGYEDYVAEKVIPETEIKGKAHQRTKDFTKQRKNLGKVKFKQCTECKYDKICEGPWKEYPEKRGDAEFKEVSSIPAYFKITNYSEDLTKLLMKKYLK